tara:strand:+ start:705 stop:1934 length:1230 start_codon:yes stop_codon:yes gene_type:complete
MKSQLIALLLGLLIIIAPVTGVEINSEPSSLEYDLNGNLIDDSKFTYNYNDLNKLVSVEDSIGLFSEYVYDGNGERVLKIDYSGDSLVETYYIGDYVEVYSDGELIENSRSYRFNGGVVAEEVNEEITYYHNDHLGSLLVSSDVNGEKVREYGFKPFGKSIGEYEERYQYTGKEYDKEVGVHFFEFRQLDPDTNMFLQPDTILPNAYDPQQLNPYAYVRNNPYKYKDESGNFAIMTALVVGWAVVEVGLFVYDVYDTVNTVSSEDASSGEKGLSIGLLAAGLFLPGGGYSKADDVVEGGIKAVDKVNDARKIQKVSDMQAFFKLDFGKEIKGILSKTKTQVKGSSIYKVTTKTDNLKKGDGIYLDTRHNDHFEVIDKNGNFKGVMNLDGTWNDELYEKARKQGRQRIDW